MKRKIEDVLIWLLSKLNKARINRCSISDKSITVGIDAFVPDDNKWHQIELTTSFWLRINDEGDVCYEEVGLWMDGNLRSKYLLQERSDK